jgi:hypothetical protein
MASRSGFPACTDRFENGQPPKLTCDRSAHLTTDYGKGLTRSH